MPDTMKSLTMDELITGLGNLQGTADSKGKGICQAAVNILFALSEDGARNTEEALDILHDYRLQAKQYKTLRNKHMVAGKPFLKDGVWHCPDCNRRVSPNHSFCHRCGKKLR
ncbi:MAG: zinc ribbon domain-containing protein [Oscillospiraceae bacterium]|nr:zinc ribbon domain-containing protein [Oscillospiraceae bacterium]